MNRRVTLATIVASVILVFAVAGMPAVQVAYAPSFPLPYKSPQITVLSPSPNGTHRTPSVPLNVTVQIFGYTYQSMEWLNSLNYSLDGQADMPLTLAYPSDYSVGYYVNGSGILSGLSDGVHNLKIVGETTIGAENRDFNATISFSVDTTPVSSSDFPTWIILPLLLVVILLIIVIVRRKIAKK